MKKVMLSAVVAASMSCGAHAADMPGDIPDATATPFSWTGFYLGANAGFGWSEFGQEAPLYSEEQEAEGAVFGGQAGYNHQFGNFVAGIEADIQWADFEVDRPAIYAGPVPLFAELEWFGTVRGRLGFAFGRFLPYITGGLAFGEVGLYLPTSPTTHDYVSDTRAGWTAGAGAEYAFTDALSVKLEYLHIDLGDDPIVFPLSSVDVETSVDFVRVGLNYRF